MNNRGTLVDQYVNDVAEEVAAMLPESPHLARRVLRQVGGMHRWWPSAGRMAAVLVLTVAATLSADVAIDAHLAANPAPSIQARLIKAPDGVLSLVVVRVIVGKPTEVLWQRYIAPIEAERLLSDPDWRARVVRSSAIRKS